MKRWYVALLDDVRYPGRDKPETVSRGGIYVEASTRAKAIRTAKQAYPGHKHYQAMVA